jgi:hypothetical protein
MNRRAYRHAIVLVLTAAVLLSPASLAAEESHDRPGREILLPRSEVLDTFLGYVAGLIRSDTSARLDISYLLELLPEVKDSEGMRHIRSIAWLHGGATEGSVLSFRFDGDLHYPIPLSILGYHPGAFDASDEIGLREIHRGYGSGALSGPYHFFYVERGFARVTFDEWFDALMGPILDTFTLEAFALLTYQREWHALLVGRGVKGQVVPWAVNLAHNKIRFPIPQELHAVAEYLLLVVPVDGAGAANQPDIGRTIP